MLFTLSTSPLSLFFHLRPPARFLASWQWIQKSVLHSQCTDWPVPLPLLEPSNIIPLLTEHPRPDNRRQEMAESNTHLAPALPSSLSLPLLSQASCTELSRQRASSGQAGSCSSLHPNVWDGAWQAPINHGVNHCPLHTPASMLRLLVLPLSLPSHPAPDELPHLVNSSFFRSHEPRPPLAKFTLALYPPPHS